MRLLALLFAVSVTGSSAWAAVTAPRVTVAQGQLQGFTDVSAAGQPYAVFQGIPYAAPPVGELRFQRPEPPAAWEGIRNATAPSARCAQLYTGELRGEEDCLYLNVYTPSLPGWFSSKRDVIVFIPGGAFNFGSGGPAQHGGGLMVDEGVVLVTLNYRVGPLGFLTTEDHWASGNYGLYDQLMALQWVRDNIAAFGGDPARVTLMGESAGAASVHLHMVSPLSRGLFRHAVSQSATALSFWALGKGQRRLARQHAAAVGCPTEDSRRLVECLRNTPVRRLISTLEPTFREWSVYPLMFLYRPRVETDVPGAFLPASPRTLLERGEFADVPWLAGFNHDEGGTFGCFSLANASALEVLRRDPDTAGPVWLGLGSETVLQPAEVYRHVRRFYFGRQRPGLTTAAAFIRAEGDRYFATGVDAAVTLHARHGSAPVFKYVLEQRPELAFPAVLAERLNNSELPHFPWGLAHKDELRYLFTGTVFPESQRDRRFAKVMTNIWATFARTGRPTTSLMEMPDWQPYSEAEDNHLRLSETPRLGTAAYRNRMSFWQSLPIDEGWRLAYREHQQEGDLPDEDKEEL